MQFDGLFDPSVTRLVISYLKLFFAQLNTSKQVEDGDIDGIYESWPLDS